MEIAKSEKDLATLKTQFKGKYEIVVGKPFAFVKVDTRSVFVPPPLVTVTDLDDEMTVEGIAIKGDKGWKAISINACEPSDAMLS